MRLPRRISRRHVVISGSAQIAPTARIGTDRRKLQVGRWGELERPTTIGAGCYVGHFCLVGAGAYLAENVILSPYCAVDGGASIGADTILTDGGSVGAWAWVGANCVIGHGRVGERCTVGSNCRIFGDLIHRQENPTVPWDAPEAEEVSPVVHDGAFIGWGAVIIGGVTIGARSYVCAGAIVTRDVPEGSIVSGVNVVSTRDTWSGRLAESRFFLP